MAMQSFNAPEYRYQFNGKEIDLEGIGGGGATYDYGFRIYNPALAKFLSVDPLSPSFPYYTPYQFAGNMPIHAIDLDGLEQFIIVNEQNADGGWKTTQALVTDDLIARERENSKGCGPSYCLGTTQWRSRISSRYIPESERGLIVPDGSFADAATVDFYTNAPSNGTLIVNVWSDGVTSIVFEDNPKYSEKATGVLRKWGILLSGSSGDTPMADDDGSRAEITKTLDYDMIKALMEAGGTKKGKGKKTGDKSEQDAHGEGLKNLEAAASDSKLNGESLEQQVERQNQINNTSNSDVQKAKYDTVIVTIQEKYIHKSFGSTSEGLRNVAKKIVIDNETNKTVDTLEIDN